MSTLHHVCLDGLSVMFVLAELRDTVRVLPHDFALAQAQVGTINGSWRH